MAMFLLRTKLSLFPEESLPVALMLGPCSREDQTEQVTHQGGWLCYQLCPHSRLLYNFTPVLDGNSVCHVKCHIVSRQAQEVENQADSAHRLEGRCPVSELILVRSDLGDLLLVGGGGCASHASLCGLCAMWKILTSYSSRI